MNENIQATPKPDFDIVETITLGKTLRDLPPIDINPTGKADATSDEAIVAAVIETA